jgi:hypothetical protein
MIYFKDGKPIQQINKGTSNFATVYWMDGRPLPLIFEDIITSLFIPKIIII